MKHKDRKTLSESTVNVVENLAYRVAELRGGRINVNHLAPYLPMSLGLLQSCLDNMADGHSVTAGEAEGFPFYEFTACLNKPCVEGPLHFISCLSCDREHSSKSENPLCQTCYQALEKELNHLAETTGWPARAVYEHEILFLAASRPNPHYAAELAGHSRYTLKRMKKKLKAMTLDHFVRQELAENEAAKNLNLEDVTISTVDNDLLDIDGMATKLGAP